MRLSRALARRIDRLAVRAHAFHRHAHHPLCERYRGEWIALRGRTRVCRGCTYALLGAISGAVLGLAVSRAAGLPLTAAAACAFTWALATRRPRPPAPTRAIARALASPLETRAHQPIDPTPDIAPALASPPQTRAHQPIDPTPDIAPALASPPQTLAHQPIDPTPDIAPALASPPQTLAHQPIDPTPGFALASPRTLAEPPHPVRASKLWTRALPAFACSCSLVALARAAHPLALLPLAAAISCWRLYRRRGPDRAPCRDCPERYAQPCSGYRPIIRAERAFVRLSQRLIDAESSSS